jgi:hypothetical protein
MSVIISPLSTRLNNFLLELHREKLKRKFTWYDEPKFNPEDINKTFEFYKWHFETNGTVPVWDDGAKDNIFADSVVNGIFRGWHDLLHVQHNLQFTLDDEIKLFDIQVKLLPEDYVYEKYLLFSEIVGQGLMHTYKDGVHDQRLFTRDFLKVISNTPRVCQ